MQVSKLSAGRGRFRGPKVALDDIGTGGGACFDDTGTGVASLEDTGGGTCFDDTGTGTASLEDTGWGACFDDRGTGVAPLEDTGGGACFDDDTGTGTASFAASSAAFFRLAGFRRLLCFLP